jgi:DNA-binding NarL/FixJ family response regulator
MRGSMAQDKPQGAYDVFIANSIYPEADPLFAVHLKSPQEIREKCVVVLDTNALLVPYTIGKKSLTEIRLVYTKLAAEQRLVIPGQVAREFANNRANKLVQLYQQLSRKISSVPELHKGKYPLLESLDKYQEATHLEEEIDILLRKYRSTVREILDHIRSWNWNDPVSLLYAEIFSKGVVFDPKFDKAETETELDRRQLHHIPPGYKDASKDDRGIGDLLIWLTILETGKARNTSILFVSGDEKADWWHKSEDQALYPRYELVDEFRRISGGNSFHIVAFSDLLDLYGVSETVVQEIREREKQERTKQDFDLNSTEIDILELSQQGMGAKEIASRLDLSEGTVRNYLSSIYEKLDVHTKIEAIQKSIEIGLLTAPEIDTHQLAAIREAMDPQLALNYFGLTSREIEILKLCQQGTQVKEMAETLDLSDGTVRNYLSSIYGKLQVNNKIEAVQKAASVGLLKPDE